MPTSLPTEVELRLTETIGAPSRARAFAARALAGWAWPGSHDDVVLVVSELVSNALKYGSGTPVLRLSGTASGVRIEVRDDSPLVPARRTPGRDGGWGLHLIDWLGGHWGVTTGDSGKVVWSELPAFTAADRRRTVA